MAVSDTVAGAIVGGGAVLAAGILAGTFGLILDSRRRRWEDRRRWHETRQRAYASFHYTTRRAMATAGRLGAFAVRVAERNESAAAAQASGKTASEDPELAQLAQAVQEEDRIADVWRERMNEASAEIDLLASKLVRDAAKSLFDVYAEVIELVQRGKETMSPGSLRDGLVDLDVRQAEATEAFRRAVKGELGIERPRRWRQPKG